MHLQTMLAYIAARLAEAWDVNQADSRAARTPEERAFVNGQRQLLQAFGAWIEIAASGSGSGRQHGRRER